jgi:hypothetical protein
MMCAALHTPLGRNVPWLNKKKYEGIQQFCSSSVFVTSPLLAVLKLKLKLFLPWLLF